AELHDPRIETTHDLMRQVRRALGFKNLRGALVVVLRRAVRQSRLDLITESLDRCDGADEVGRVLVEIVRDVLVELAHFGDAAFQVLLDRLACSPSAVDIRLLLGAFDQLFAWGDADAAASVAVTAVEESAALGDAGLRADA